MNILLINPFVENLYRVPPLGLGYLGSALKEEGHIVKIIDGALMPISDKILKKEIRQFNPEVIGITAFTIQYSQACEIFTKIKKINPKVIIVFGGQHATALYEEVMKNNANLDYIIRGEGEIVFSQFIKNINNQNELFKISGLVYRKSGKIIANPYEPITNINILPYPWKVINPLDYQTKEVHGYVFKNLPIAPIISSRGCPYNCTFCGGRVVLGNKIRRRSVENFVNEIIFLINKFGIREFQIVDDNFTFFRDHAKDICKEIIKRNLNISWSLPNGIRADRVDKKLLKLMKDSGCFYLAFGFEFGSSKILRLVKKGINERKAKKTAKIANELGFINHGFFLMGYPDETEQDIKKTINLMTSLPLDRVSIGFVLPLPGSELFTIYKNNNYFPKKINWDKFTDGFVPVTPKLSFKTLIKLRKQAYIKFYSNPIRLIRHILKLKNFNQLIGVFKGFNRVIWQSKSISK